MASSIEQALHPARALADTDVAQVTRSLGRIRAALGSPDAERAAVRFVDALTAAQVRRLPDATVVSFDRDFDRIEGLTRREP